MHSDSTLRRALESSTTWRNYLVFRCARSTGTERRAIIGASLLRFKIARMRQQCRDASTAACSCARWPPERRRPAQDRPRARDLGIAPGAGTPGPLNAITDVAGVRVGHTTVVDGDAVRTGVTAILPHGGNLFREKVPGAVFVGNAFGKLAGSTQVEELGTIETPIVLTNTLSRRRGARRGRPLDARAAGQRERALGQRARRRDQRRRAQRHPRPARHARARHRGDRAARRPARSTRARSAPAPARSRSAGRAASARRRAASGSGTTTWTVGVLVQTNYGGRLTIAGVPVWQRADAAPAASRRRGAAAATRTGADGSCMIVVATDAPLDARDLERLAARAIFALARTGSTYSNGSGDFAIAFSTHPSLARDRHERPAAADDPADRRACRACSRRCSTRPKRRSTTRCSRRPTRPATAARSARCRSRRSRRSSRSTDDEAGGGRPIGALASGPRARSAGGTLPDERRHRLDLRDGQRRGRPARAESGQGRLHRPRRREAARDHALLERRFSRSPSSSCST